MDFLTNPFVLSFLRLVHIFGGMIWVGFGAVGAWVVNPLAQNMGEKGDVVLRRFYGYSNFNKVFPIAAISTTAAGLIMWGGVVDGMDFINFGGTGDIVMLVGAVVGLLAFGHGAGATGRFVAAYAKAARAYEDADTPTDEQKSTLADLRGKVFTHSNISAILTVIAAVAMSSARYLA